MLRNEIENIILTLLTTTVEELRDVDDKLYEDDENGNVSCEL